MLLPTEKQDKSISEVNNYEEEVMVEESDPQLKKSFGQWFVIFLVVVVLVAIFLYKQDVKPPTNFPIDQPIEIPLGTSVVQISKILKKANVVRSEFLLYAILVASYQPNDIKASTYAFSTPLSVYEVANALTEGNYLYDLVRLTHKEGMSVKALAPVVNQMLPHISPEEFIAYTTKYEGELFPETYFVPKDISLEDLVTLMRETHLQTMQKLEEIPQANTLAKADVVILASILEREANSDENMKEVANILLRRLEMDMPLQVDATMEYILDKPLSELTAEDLTVDSPYNTYTRYGLPPTAIGNPGLSALKAVINADGNTPYQFYITGNDGEFYYAKNFAEHKLNIERYLK